MTWPPPVSVRDWSANRGEGAVDAGHHVGQGDGGEDRRPVGEAAAGRQAVMASMRVPKPGRSR